MEKGGGAAGRNGRGTGTGTGGGRVRRGCGADGPIAVAPSGLGVGAGAAGEGGAGAGAGLGRAFSRCGTGSRGGTRFGRIRGAPDTDDPGTRRSQDAPFPGRAMGIDGRPRVGQRETALPDPGSGVLRRRGKRYLSRHEQRTDEGLVHEPPIRRRIRALPPRPRGVLGRGGRGRLLAPPLGPGAGRPAGALLPLVRGRRGQHLLQRGRPARRDGPRRAAGRRLRQPRHRPRGAPHLRRAPGRDRALRRRPRPARGRTGRPGRPLHADGPRGDRRDARVRAPRGGAQRGVRRVRVEGARRAHRRLRAQGDPERVVRDRARTHRRVQAASRRRARARPPSPGPVRHPPAPRASRPPRSGARPRLGGFPRRRRAARVRAGRGHRSSLHPLHLRHHRPSRRGWCATTAGTSWPSSGR